MKSFRKMKGDSMWKEVFDKFAETYDQDVLDADNQNQFPYAGYQKILDFIASDIDKDSHMGKLRILDLGIGTGTLEAKVKPEKVDITGIDLSEKMLEVAQLKLHAARLFCADFRKGLPEEIRNDKFDIIVATYAMHHLGFEEWMEYVHYLSHHLTVFGKIYIGDILFVNENEKRLCRTQNLDSWDDDEHYHVYEAIVAKICDHLAASFLKISFCAGVIILENYHECTLQPDELLVKY
jgi:putative AdoMet-dependent methyltransferase